MDPTSVEEFYKEVSATVDGGLAFLLPEGMGKGIGHFNVFSVDEILKRMIQPDATMPYNRRTYYKISLVVGHNIGEYADKLITIEDSALIFATPKIPYNWIPQDQNQSGYFCIFTADFLLSGKSGIALDELPIFRPGGCPVFTLTDTERGEINAIFKKMYAEITSDYAYKQDLLRNYVMELIHYGQKLQPATSLYTKQNASARVSALFMELLERQFPIESPQQKLSLRTAKDYAERLSVHVNHLNKALKEDIGKTTTDIISSRVVQEAKILLKHTDWNISEIAFSLGFEEVAHFSNFFKKQTTYTPVSFRA